MNSAPASNPVSGGIEHLLVRGVNWLGDAVMSLPALSALRVARPGMRVTVAAPAKIADVYSFAPGVDSVMPLEKGSGLWKTAGLLRASGADTALLLPNSPRVALEAWLAGIPRRVGIRRPWRNAWLTQIVEPRSAEQRMTKLSVAEIRRRIAAGKPASRPDSNAHHVYHYLHLAAALGAVAGPSAPRLLIPEQTRLDCARPWLAGPGTEWLGVNPGAEYGPAKRWPAERFARAVAEFTRGQAIGVMLFGGPGDIGICERLESELVRMRGVEASGKVINAAGRTDLRTFCALLASCRVVLTNDTGPMHLAAAAGARVVALFGSTSPVLTGPGDPESTDHTCLSEPVPCAPCFLRECPVEFNCMKLLDVARVVQALREQWAKAGERA